MIDVILDAAARILGERGWASLTTNSVAEVAFVSIGSVYQYFPNKFVLVEAVRRRHFDDVICVLRAAADKTMTRKSRIEALVDGMIAVHSRHPAAHRVLLEEAPRIDGAQTMHDDFRTECQRAYEAIVVANVPGETDPANAALVLAGAIAGAVHEAARSGKLAVPALRQELIMFVGSYLHKKRAARRS